MALHPIFAEIFQTMGMPSAAQIPAHVCYAAEQLDCLRRAGIQDAKRYTFGKWTIYFDPPPIPPGIADWHFVHEDDDGAPDGYAGRSGFAGNLRDALTEIDILLDDMAEECGCSVVTLDDCKGTLCPLRFTLQPTN